MKRFNLILLLLGALSLMLSGINWHMGFAAWIAPILLLLYTRNVQWNKLWIFFIVISIAGALSQTNNNPTKLFLVHVYHGLVFGILSSIPYLIEKIFYKKSRYIYTLIFPSSIALVEYFASMIIGTWGSIAHTQYGFLSFRQITSITGIFGVWFFVSWFASTVNWFIENKNNKRSTIHAGIIFGGIFILILIYGNIKLHKPTEKTEEVKIACVINNYNKLEDAADFIRSMALGENVPVPSNLFSDTIAINKMKQLTIEASKKADIIVWSEVALILTQKQKQVLISDIKNICTQKEVYILLSFYEECLEKDKKPFNNVAIIVSPQGEKEWEYKKSFLTPIIETSITNRGDYNMPALKTLFGTIGCVICADMDMQHYIKQASEKNIDILLIPAIDYKGIIPLHTQMASIHSIQFGFSIVRSNGIGVTSIYNSVGKEITSFNSLKSNDRILFAALPVKSNKTFYGRYGDVFILLCGLFIAIIAFTHFILKRQS